MGARVECTMTGAPVVNHEHYVSRHIFSRGSYTSSTFTAVVFLYVLGAHVVHAHNCYVITRFGLKTADCNKRALLSVPDDLDSDVKILFMTDNAAAMRQLSADALHPYSGLQELYLTRDGIDSIALGAFRHTRNLQKLDLEGNALAAVPTRAFEPLAYLRVLILSGNPLSRLPADAFRPLVSLEMLELENCRLDYVDPRALQTLVHLGQLNIINNALRTVEAATEQYLPPALKVLRAHNNPWHCDCRLRWLRLWLARPQINWEFAGDSRPICSSPAIVANIPWTHLKPDQFACPSRIETGINGTNGGSTELRSDQGGNVTFQCRVFGDPRPIIEWMKGSQSVQATNGRHNAHVFNVIATDERTGEQYVLSTLLLHKAYVDNIGEYRCVAENSAGRSEVMFKLVLEVQQRAEQVSVDDTTVAQAKVVNDFSVEERSVLTKIIVGAGTVILMLVGIVIVLARQRCTQIRGAKRRQRNNELRNGRGRGDGERLATAIPTISMRMADDRNYQTQETSTSLRYNMLGEFSRPMSTFRNCDSPLIVDNNRNGNDDIETKLKVNLEKQSHQSVSDVQYAPRDIVKQKLFSLNRPSLEDSETLIKAAQILDTEVATSSLAHNSPPKRLRPVTQPENTTADSCDNDFTSSSMPTAQHTTAEGRHRGLCQNPVCVKTHTRVAASVAGSSATLGHASRPPSNSNYSNGRLRTSRSLDNIGSTSDNDFAHLRAGLHSPVAADVVRPTKFINPQVDDFASKVLEQATEMTEQVEPRNGYSLLNSGSLANVANFTLIGSEQTTRAGRSSEGMTAAMEVGHDATQQLTTFRYPRPGERDEYGTAV